MVGLGYTQLQMAQNWRQESGKEAAWEDKVGISKQKQKLQERFDWLNLLGPRWWFQIQ